MNYICSIFDMFDSFRKKQKFIFFASFFSHRNCSRPEIDIIWYRKAYIFVSFHYFWDQSRALVGFVVSSVALLVQNASLLTPLYLEKNYAHWKRIVKHISKLYFSIKNVNVSLIENLQLAETAIVLFFRAWRESSTSY